MILLCLTLICLPRTEASAAAAAPSNAAAAEEEPFDALLFTGDGESMQQQQRELEYYNQQRSLSGMGMDGNGGGNQLLPSFGMDHGNGGGKLPPSSGMYASSFNTSAKPAAIDDAYHNYQFGVGGYGVTPTVPSSTPGTTLGPSAEETQSEIVEVRDAGNYKIMEADEGDTDDQLAVQGVVDAFTRTNTQYYVPQIVNANKMLAKKNMPADERLSKLVKLNKVREAAKEKEGKGKK